MTSQTEENFFLMAAYSYAQVKRFEQQTSMLLNTRRERLRTFNNQGRLMKWAPEQGQFLDSPP